MGMKLPVRWSLVGSLTPPLRPALDASLVHIGDHFLLKNGGALLLIALENCFHTWVVHYRLNIAWQQMSSHSRHDGYDSPRNGVTIDDGKRLCFVALESGSV